jgi:dynein heavy chain
MIPSTRSFCSALRVWESIQVENETLLQTEKVFTGYESIEELRRYAKMPEKLEPLERTIKAWTSTVSQIVAESDRLRKEVDSNGPQDEVEYWKRRASLLSILHQKIHGGEMRFTILCLSIAGSNALKVWKNLEHRVAYVFNEAKDISAYIDRIDHIAHPLYLDTPSTIIKGVNGLMQTVMLIQTSSMFYNTSEKISHLLVKITNQMIYRCKTYLTLGGKQSIWVQNRHSVLKKILECIQLNKVYRKAYKLHYEKTRPRRDKDFCISEHYVFGKFDAFCERLKKILTIFETLGGYETLFKTHVCGLLWDDTIDEKEKEFTLNVKLLTGKDYNYLEYRNKDFDADFEDFVGKTEELRLALNKMIERSYNDIWESPQAIKFLKRIEEVNKFVRNINYEPFITKYHQ